LTTYLLLLGGKYERKEFAVVFDSASLRSVLGGAAGDEQRYHSKSKTRTIIGCLTKGEHSASSNEYLLTANDGSTWEVRGDSVALSKHLGHEVTATGTVENNTMHNMKEDTKSMAHDTGTTKENKEHGHMTIADLEHISDTCQK
jgi:hypothetical protein